VKIKLAYGKKGVDIHLRDDLNTTVVESKHLPGLEDQTESVRDALRHPIGVMPLKDSVKSSEKVAIVFNDITRPPALLDELEHVPGLGLLETVLRNHSVNNLDDPMATWGKTDGNPVWEEIFEAASIVQPAFLLNVTLNRHKHITGVFAGDLNQSHRQGCTFVKQNAMIPVKEPYDIVITCNSGYPLDLNLYQSIKGISAAAQIVKEGGSIIMAADCWDGIPEHGEYAELLRKANGPEHLLQTIRSPGFSVQDMWQAQIQAHILQKADVYFYSRNLSDQQITGAMFQPCHNIEATIDMLLREHGREASICILPDGPQSIPYIDDT
jgi:nickel-dependent lactate racemase